MQQPDRSPAAMHLHILVATVVFALHAHGGDPATHHLDQTALPETLTTPAPPSDYSSPFLQELYCFRDGLLGQRGHEFFPLKGDGTLSLAYLDTLDGTWKSPDPVFIPKLPFLRKVHNADLDRDGVQESIALDHRDVLRVFKHGASRASATIAEKVVDFAVGDVDADGTLELVTVGEQTAVYRLRGDLQRLCSHPESWGVVRLVDAATLDPRRRVEQFVAKKFVMVSDESFMQNVANAFPSVLFYIDHGFHPLRWKNTTGTEGELVSRGFFYLPWSGRGYRSLLTNSELRFIGHDGELLGRSRFEDLSRARRDNENLKFYWFDIDADGKNEYIRFNLIRYADEPGKDSRCQVYGVVKGRRRTEDEFSRLLSAVGHEPLRRILVRYLADGFASRLVLPEGIQESEYHEKNGDKTKLIVAPGHRLQMTFPDHEESLSIEYFRGKELLFSDSLSVFQHKLSLIVEFGLPYHLRTHIDFKHDVNGDAIPELFSEYDYKPPVHYVHQLRLVEFTK